MAYDVQYTTQIPALDTLLMEDDQYLMEITNKRFSTQHFDWENEIESS
jgi:hypothetical protein